MIQTKLKLVGVLNNLCIARQIRNIKLVLYIWLYYFKMYCSSPWSVNAAD